VPSIEIKTAPQKQSSNSPFRHSPRIGTNSPARFNRSDKKRGANAQGRHQKSHSPSPNISVGSGSVMVFDDAKNKLSEVFDSKVVEGLKERAWKTRVAALTTLLERVKEMGMYIYTYILFFFFLALFAVLNKTPGWKDTNVQACGLVYQIATEVCLYVLRFIIIYFFFFFFFCICVCVCVYTMCVCVCVCVCTICIHTYIIGIHTYIHTYIIGIPYIVFMHTYIHTYIIVIHMHCCRAYIHTYIHIFLFTLLSCIHTYNIHTQEKE